MTKLPEGIIDFWPTQGIQKVFTQLKSYIILNFSHLMSFNADFWRFPLRISTLPSGVLHRVVVCHSTQSSISVRKTNVDVVFILPLISPAAERLPVVFIFLFSLLYIIQYCSEKLLLLQKKMSAWKLEWIVPSFTDFHSITNSSGVKLEPSVGGGWRDNIYIWWCIWFRSHVEVFGWSHCGSFASQWAELTLWSSWIQWIPQEPAGASG